MEKSLRAKLLPVVAGFSIGVLFNEARDRSRSAFDADPQILGEGEWLKDELAGPLTDDLDLTFFIGAFCLATILFDRTRRRRTDSSFRR